MEIKIEFHEAANEFPLLDKDRLSELANDIEKNGLRESIKLFKGKIVDGRNRYNACLEKGIEPEFQSLPDGIDPFTYVWSLNGERRDITQDQRYLIWKSCSEKSESFQAALKAIQDEANKKRSEAAKEQERSVTETGKTFFMEKESQVVPQPVARPDKPKRTSKKKADASKTNRGTVERMDRLSKKRPDLAEQVKVGEIKATAAIREMKREEIKNTLEDIKVQEVKAVAGVFDVIVIDPPWPMKKIERDERPNQSEFDYPTMTEEELSALKIPADTDCHIWLWTTHKFLPMAFRLLEEWDMKYVCTFVWHKPGGFQPIGLPQYNCEMALYARKGTPQFLDTKAFPVCFNASRGKHSEKPKDFYDTVCRVTAGRRLDMFSRRAIDGFSSWGNES